MIGYGTLFGRSTTCDQDGAYTVRFALPLRIKRCQPRLNWIGTGGALVDNGTRFGWQPPAGWRSTTCDHDEAYTVEFALPLRIEGGNPHPNRTITVKLLFHNGTRFQWLPPPRCSYPPSIRTGHTPLDSPCLCESNAANHASTG